MEQYIAESVGNVFTAINRNELHESTLKASLLIRSRCQVTLRVDLCS